MKCQECDNEFDSRDRRRKYCTRSCSATANNRKKPKRQRKLTRGSGSCLDCGTSISCYAQRCTECAPRSKSRERVAAWLAGEWDGNCADGLSETIRNFLLLEANFQCRGCGWGGVNPFTGRSTLQVNHIDGDAFNNERINLEVLCPNCHSLTENFGSLNSTSTRVYRYH